MYDTVICTHRLYVAARCSQYSALYTYTCTSSIQYSYMRSYMCMYTGSIISDFNAARVNPGEMAGVLAAQSIGALYHI